MKADHDQVTRLLKTARGQIDGILKMVEEDRYCLDVSNQLMATQSILKKAIARRLGRAYGMDTLPETGAVYQVRFSILKDRAALMLDTSGESLYKRGYRAQNMGAPLRETLAAALVALTHYRGRDPSATLLRLGHHPHRGRLIAKTGSGPEPLLLRPEVELAPRSGLDGCRR